MNNPIEIDNVDISKIRIQPSKGNNHKSGDMFNVYHDTQRLEIVLPEMIAPFGAKILTDYGCKISLPLTFDGIKEDNSRGHRLVRAHKKMIEIQDKIRDLILANPTAYFSDKKKQTPEDYKKRIKDFVVSSESKDGKKYDDLFRVEIQKRNVGGEKDKDKTPEELEMLKKEFASKMGMPLLKNKAKQVVQCNQDNVAEVLSWGTKIKPVVSFAYIWIMKTGDRVCTPKWFLTHGLITDHKKMDIDLTPDDDDDDEEVEEVEEEYEEDDDDEDMEVSAAQA
jgi:hypothetical protein